MKRKPFELKQCETGKDFEDWVESLFYCLGFGTKSTRGNDNGVDIIATRKFAEYEIKLYIQCKFYNKRLSKHPIQEVYTGHHFWVMTATQW